MSLNDPLANVLSGIRNGDSLGKKEFVSKSASSFIKKVLDILQQEGYIGQSALHEDSKGVLLEVNLIGAVNKTGVIKPRFTIKKDGYEKYEKRFLPARDFGVIIVSTNQGLMTHVQAKEKGLGGRLVCYCY